MVNAFSIDPSRCASISDPELRRQILAHTGSDAETSSILRSLERFGGDTSIRYFEITPRPTRRTYHGAPIVAWSVRAERP